MPTVCNLCRLKYNCVCEHLPSIDVRAHIAILMHENEQSRETNTGRWLLQSIQTTSRHIWQRNKPCSRLISLISDPSYKTFLLFPEEESQLVDKAIQLSEEQGKKPLFIIIDSTWQEAKKILRKSPWLADLPKVSLQTSAVSNYQLRRNQEPGHLCTLEVGAEIVQALGDTGSAEKLSLFLDHYNKVFHADKSGHQF
ncbi:tRNA-uridine aminocarboxypropyltransferase [Vibrio aquimaris]|uniref:tRNA-uridine aminocarboxypropyltransferase n=1 Tax=Vibrio aquimaris TaxID=2587862 RepID=A0A5P9CMQ4_9VIBR|nr:DTW domain-containing protein [Vibrio aquimaris]QFT27496.1 DTW domain protein [Vibrio aquimaris]